jgi:hypothetical protein
MIGSNGAASVLWRLAAALLVCAASPITGGCGGSSSKPADAAAGTGGAGGAGGSGGAGRSSDAAGSGGAGGSAGSGGTGGGADSGGSGGAARVDGAADVASEDSAREDGGGPARDGSPACPGAQPVAASACPAADLGPCYFGNTICYCYPQRSGPAWACGMAPPGCPQTIPAEGSPCSTSGMRCSYDFRGCATVPSATVCENGAWVTHLAPCS